MKKSVFSIAFLSAALAANAAVVESVTARQQWPWSADIKVGYVLSCVDAAVDLHVSAENGATTVEIPASAIKGDVFGIAKAGAGTLTIDPVKAFGAEQVALADLKIKISVTDSTYDPDEALYKIFDLTSGMCENVTRRDLLNGKWGAVETSYRAIDPSFTTDLEDVLIWTDVTNNPAYKTDKLVMRKIKAKDKVWQSGDTDGYQKHNFSSAPRKWIKLNYDYYIGVFEVTLEQYKKMYGSYPSGCALGPAGSEYLVPANKAYYYSIIGYTMSDYADYNTIVCNEKLWFPNNTYVRDVGKQSYCAKMWSRTKCEFTLPTQVEWEFASRGGTYETLYSGETQNEANTRKLAWTSADGGYVHVVGTKLPNAYGLYDTLGNAMERTLSLGNTEAGATSGTGDSEADPAVNPIGRVTTSRSEVGYSYGGGVLSDAGYWSDCRSGSRTGWTDYGNARTDCGFRVVMPARPDGQWADHQAQ